jgi:hypothetical protein
MNNNPRAVISTVSILNNISKVRYFIVAQPIHLSKCTSVSRATLSDNIMVEAPGHIAIKLSPVIEKIHSSSWNPRKMDYKYCNLLQLVLHKFLNFIARSHQLNCDYFSSVSATFFVVQQRAN